MTLKKLHAPERNVEVARPHMLEGVAIRRMKGVDSVGWQLIGHMVRTIFEGDSFNGDSLRARRGDQRMLQEVPQAAPLADIMLATLEEGVMRTTVRTVVCSAALVLAGVCQAQPYPNQPVHIIVPFAAGGPTDVIARVVGQKLAETLGQPFLIENVPGAGGNTGTARAAKSPPNGYTLLATSTGFIVNPMLYARGVPYDPVKDFAPVTLIAASPNVLSVNPGVPAKTVHELISLVKANPGKYSFAQPATGSTPHLNGELFKLEFGLDLTMVPFNGAAPAVMSTVGGHTPIAFTALPSAITQIREGKLRALAVLSLKRARALPDVPTAAEAGIPGHEGDTLTGMVVPVGTPKEIVEHLYGEIKRLVALPDVKEKLEALGFNPVANRPEEFGERIRTETVRWGKVIRDAKIKIE